jgi:hypothetical protein
MFASSFCVPLFRRWLGFTLLGLPILVACSGADTSNTLACSCPGVEDPVCGSDGVTYENGCNAECAGAKIVQAGDCPQDAGTCSCAPTSDPVCGANGITYENACSATCAHVAIAHAGVCIAPQPDASTTASSPGSCAIQTCDASQVCVDEACSAQTCWAAGDGGVCPAGTTYGQGFCSPGGGSPGGVCTRPCPAPTHHCVTPSCSPAMCSCLPVDVCGAVGGMCNFVSDGTVMCVVAGKL